MNIFEGYIKKNKQLIILILGLPCSNKSELAKELIIDLNIPKLNINNYIKEDSYIEKTINDVKFKLYEHPDNYNWDKLNHDVNEVKNKGLVIYGNYIDINKIDFDIDFIYFVNMNTNLCKTILIEKKLLPYENDDEKVKIYFKDIFNPIYEELKNKLKINKFFNVKENTTFDEIYDELFENLMELIHKNIK
jgi:uridine kinase